MTACVVVLALSAKARATTGGVSDYAPLPPPPPPPADLAAKPAIRVPRAPAATATAEAAISQAPTSQAPTSQAPTSQATTSSATVPAAAEPPPGDTPAPPSRAELDDERFSVSPLLGFGTNNLGLGVGVRAGAAAIATRLWIGGTFLFHNGASHSGAVGGVPYFAGSSLVYFGAEIGYDFEIGPILLRPFGGVGPALLSVSASSGNVSASSTATSFIVWAGGTLLYGIPGTRVFVGGDGRMITVPAGPALALCALGGMTF